MSKLILYNSTDKRKSGNAAAGSECDTSTRDGLRVIFSSVGAVQPELYSG